MSQALILVDIQNDYFPGGAVELVGMDAAADNAAKILGGFRDQEKPVFHIQHLSVRPGATFFIPDTEGAEHHEKVQPTADEAVIQKNYPSSFRETDLEERLQKSGISELVIVGAMSHMCIDATTRAAFDAGFECTVIEDACATRDLQFKDETIPAKQVHGAFMAALASPYATVIAANNFAIK